MCGVFVISPEKCRGPKTESFSSEMRRTPQPLVRFNRRFILGHTLIFNQRPTDTGHGANMAMEDGEALGFVFQDISSLPLETPEQLTSAIQERFETFLSIRLKRARYVQISARQAGGIAKPEEGRFNPQAFSRTMHPYRGAAAALASPETQPSYEIGQ